MVAAPDVVVCFLAALAHNILYCAHCNFHCGGGDGGCICLLVV